MAQSPQDQLEGALTAAVSAAIKLKEGTPTRLTVDIQPNGEYPYQVQLLEEQHPYVGLAKAGSRT
jgi:hypothetical protein